MGTTVEAKTTLREVDRSKYPELRDYTKEDIWRDMGPGGLYLVSLAAKELHLQPNALVLDLGCGSAASSLYLADNYQACVIAADLWHDPGENAKRIESRGMLSGKYKASPVHHDGGQGRHDH
jgi:cyclopropane fatty-acyl-phospholipid synthase-like methyltransferase